MKKTNNDSRDWHLVSRYLRGQMDNTEEKSFFEMIDDNEEFRKLVVTEAVLYKNYKTEYEHCTNYLKKTKKSSKDCLSFCHHRDIEIDKDNK